MDDMIGVTEELTPEMAVAGYGKGLFPMAEMRLGLVTWHQPDPRAIIPLDRFHTSRSLRKTLRKGTFKVTYDQDFLGVMKGCAGREPTWISDEFLEVYGELHQLGKAHSVEVWRNGALVGGVYGIHLGGAFMAESKFHTVTDASKVALAKLVARLRERGFKILEVQYVTEHLLQFGTEEISLEDYLEQLAPALEMECSFV